MNFEKSKILSVVLFVCMLFVISRGSFVFAVSLNQSFAGAPLGTTGSQTYDLDGMTYTTNDLGAKSIEIVNNGDLALGGDYARVSLIRYESDNRSHV